MDTQKPYDHLNDDSEGYYPPIQKCLDACWKATTPEFKKVWEKLHDRWIKDNIMEENNLINPKQLFCRVGFFSGAILSIDLERLSPDHWLLCVVTLRDLIDMLDMIYYGLSDEELSAKIFEHSAEEDNEDCYEDDDDDTVFVLRNINGVTTISERHEDKNKDK